MDTSSITIAF